MTNTEKSNIIIEITKIIDKKNTGYGSSMNQGLDLACGEYIGIVEPDDFVKKTMFEDLYNLAIKNDAQMVKSDYFYYYSSNKQARRAEGTCRFEGIAPKNKPIMMMDGWFFSRGTSLTGTVKFFRVSKEDFLLLQQSVGNASIKKDETKIVVGVYGAPFSNTDLAYKTHLIKELSHVEHLENKHLVPHYFHTLEEMKSNYIKMQEKINKKKDFKVTYGTDATSNTIKVAVVFDFKKSTEAYNYVKEECTNYTALGPVSNVDGMLDKIKIIIKKAEGNEMSKMTEERKETMVEAPEENVKNNVPVTEETKVEMKNEKGLMENPKDNSVSKASKDNMGVKII